MEISLVAAKVLGIYLVISGLFLIFRGKTVPHLLKDFFGHPAIVYLTGVVLIFLSTLFLVLHNVWDGSWRTIVTIFMWIVLLKGVAYIFVPETLHKFVGKKVLETLNYYGLVAVSVGLALFFLA
ncbi:MAG: hypothetical protein NT108_01655 [Candidatus Kaiserbacteria bacterium]|nr:hypothetical protein [Candidatus Kaiserbacteria bacterium]